MAQARFRFYAQLNDHLPLRRRQIAFWHRFAGHVAVKDLIEAIGVPHTEVDVILVNGAFADFSHQVPDGATISVYPAFESFELPPGCQLGVRPPGPPGFVLDAHLGRLAAYLRLLGFDVLYPNNDSDSELARQAAESGRVLLTRDRGLLKRRCVTRGYFVRALRPRAQVVEVVRRFGLAATAAPFSRCLRCNGRLETAEKASVRERLPPRTRESFDEFRRCTACDHVYWAGAHYPALQRLVAEVLTQAGRAGLVPEGA
jgi:uncharacterized protein with PIN domain